MALSQDHGLFPGSSHFRAVGPCAAPADIGAYSHALGTYVENLQQELTGKGVSDLDVGPLRDAVSLLDQHAGQFTEFDNEWHSQIFAAGGFETSLMGLKRLERNARLAHFEKQLLDEAGLVNRTQFKHVVFGPQKWSGYDEAFFPGIRDWVEVGDMRKAQEELIKVAGIIKQAAGTLVVGH